MPTRSLSTDQLRNFKFHVILSRPGNYPNSAPRSLASLGFAAVDGLGINIQNIEYREGGMNTTSRKLPGQATFGPITLSHGATLGPVQSWNWILELFSAIQGAGTGQPGTFDEGFRCDGQIYVMEHPVTYGPFAGGGGVGPYPYRMKFQLYNVWPSGLIYSNLDAGGNAVFMEQLILQHEGFDVTFAQNSAAGQYIR